MRTDENLAGGSVRRSQQWKTNEIGENQENLDSRLDIGDEVIDGKLAVHSLSGKERNRFFINESAGGDFVDLSGLSGMDAVADSRCFVLFDYDRDGWQDVAVVNSNQPQLQLFHNDIAELSGARERGMIAIRLEGGNRSSGASELSNRDGYGAMVEVALEGGLKLKREHRCGEGYAAQNSSTMIVGIGEREGVESITVRWPSGKETRYGAVNEGTLVTAYENREGGAFEESPYRTVEVPEVATARREKFPAAQESPAKLHVYTTTATWCAACKGHLPTWERLGEEEGVAIFGVPVDPEDDAAKLASYVEEWKPAYQMLADLDDTQRGVVTSFLGRRIGLAEAPLPSTVITDAEGGVLEVMMGVPTLSDLRRLLDANR